ncbi:MAG: hypothetical protein WC438_03005 [Candidatus Pacearchaeota archaeon]
MVELGDDFFEGWKPIDLFEKIHKTESLLELMSTGYVDDEFIISQGYTPEEIPKLRQQAQEIYESDMKHITDYVELANQIIGHENF